jgi:hypothetical protein
MVFEHPDPSEHRVFVRDLPYRAAHIGGGAEDLAVNDVPLPEATSAAGAAALRDDMRAIIVRLVNALRAAT